jgi:hypothetical protein
MRRGIHAARRGDASDAFRSGGLARTWPEDFFMRAARLLPVSSCMYEICNSRRLRCTRACAWDAMRIRTSP